MPTYFQGKTLISPQAVSAVDDSALAANNISGSATVGIVGPSTGGQPNTALTFTRFADASVVLRSGALLDAVRRAFDPGASTPGAPKVIAVRIASPLQGTLTLLDGAAANAVVLTSADYGAWTNQIRVSVATGTSQGKKVTLATPVSGVVQNLVGDNIYRPSFTVLYTGAGTVATMTITATTLTTTITGAAGDNLSLAFTNQTTMQSLVDAMNATGKYTAAVLGSNTAATTALDGATAVDVKTTTYTATSTLQAVIDFFNTTPYVTAARGAGILPPANIGFTYLASGSDGSAPTNTDWTTGLVALEAQDVGFALVADGTAAVHALAVAHVTAMSDIAGKRERITVLGGVAGETSAQAIARAAAIASFRAGLVWPGIKDLDPTTQVLTVYPPYIVAAAVAGTLAGGQVTDAATGKAIGAQALETIVSDSTADLLITGGVIPIRSITGKGFRVAQSLSTYTADGTYSKVELSTRRTADYVSKAVRDALSELVGLTTGPALLAQSLSRTNSVLRQLQSDGILVGTLTAPAFKNVQASISGNKVVVEYTAAVGIPANYVLITAHLTAFTASQ